jgi:hypothetical protein
VRYLRIAHSPYLKGRANLITLIARLAKVHLNTITVRGMVEAVSEITRIDRAGSRPSKSL